MSPKQTTFYFTLWNRVMVEQGWYHLPTAEKDAKRRALHAQANCPESSKEFTNQHFNRFKARCEAILAGKNDGGTQIVDEKDAVRRLVWRIKDDAKKAGLSPEYIIDVARDIHVLGNWEDLDLESLTNLMRTIHNRAGKKVGHDTRSMQGAPRHYVINKVPRQFVPHPNQPVPHIPNDNEPF